VDVKTHTHLGSLGKTDDRLFLFGFLFGFLFVLILVGLVIRLIVVVLFL
jgi:hypothetical protein